MVKSKFRMSVLVLLSFLLVGTANATTFEFEYFSTVNQAEGIANVSAGDTMRIEVGLDNGNNTLVSQTWTASDLEYVLFEFNGGAQWAKFTSLFIGEPYLDSGSFITDEKGDLTSVMSKWCDFYVDSGVILNDLILDGSLGWGISGLNAVLFEMDSDIVIGIENVRTDIDPGYWSVKNQPVPEPATVMLFGIGLLSIAGVGRRKK